MGADRASQVTKRSLPIFDEARASSKRKIESGIWNRGSSSLEGLMRFLIRCDSIQSSDLARELNRCLEAIKEFPTWEWCLFISSTGIPMGVRLKGALFEPFDFVDRAIAMQTKQVAFSFSYQPGSIPRIDFSHPEKPDFPSRYAARVFWSPREGVFNAENRKISPNEGAGLLIGDKTIYRRSYLEILPQTSMLIAIF